MRSPSRPFGRRIGALAGAVLFLPAWTSARPADDAVHPLPDAVLDREYRAALPLAWAAGKVESKLEEGSMPSGLVVDGAWVRGRPKETGKFSFVVLAKDEIGQHDRARFSVEVLPPPAAPIAILDAEFTACTAWVPYAQPLCAQGGYPPYVWEIDAILPEGLSLRGDGIEGTIRGTPARKETVKLSIRVKDRLGSIASASRSIRIEPNPALILRLAWSPGPGADGAKKAIDLPASVVTEKYFLRVPFTGGVPPISIKARGGLPEGVELVEDSLRGSPGRTGEFTFTIEAKDSVGQSAEAAFRLRVLPPAAPALEFSPPAAPPAVLGEPYAFHLSTSGGIAPLRWEAAAGSLPGWARLEAGMVLGTPPDVSALGETTVSFTVSDSGGGREGPRPVTLRVGSNPRFPPPSAGGPLPWIIAGAAYRAAIPVTGGLPPYRLSLLSGKLPPGISLEKEGILTGTTKSLGSWPFTVKVTDRLGQASPAAEAVLLVREPALSPLRLGPGYTIIAEVGSGFEFQIPASGGTLPYSFEWEDRAIPEGVHLDEEKGILTGTPAVAWGVHRGVVYVRDASPDKAQAKSEIVIRIVRVRVFAWPSPVTLAGAVLGTAIACLVPAFLLRRRRQKSAGPPRTESVSAQPSVPDARE